MALGGYMLLLRRGCLITARPLLLDSRRCVIGGHFARVLTPGLRSRSLPICQSPVYMIQVMTCPFRLYSFLEMLAGGTRPVCHLPFRLVHQLQVVFYALKARAV